VRDYVTRTLEHAYHTVAADRAEVARLIDEVLSPSLPRPVSILI
jgi:hypothetical protein